ncbi:DUF4129 domain-containing protein [Corallococcus macrosporus]|uniref:Protein-glutamine gamma-glutamyltransferase-like C-terminal domain-containing protein n=1 Tax=Myxococcus fulvus (strain ATCC BAA-855 / HW-1) TaxID=483219 RepID=F8CBV2_MYXFH|nr:DUF4129 domain-containing protein [Corallococcus macrosporus]AEI65918.1 hypothetical protein LILAB_20080 [Corallococcus macrosporus]
MAVSALELRPRNAVALMDAALRLSSRSAGVWALTLPGGAAVVAAMLYLAESARMGWPLAVPSLLLTLAWFLRGVGQGAASHYVQELLLGTQGEPSAWASLRAALGRIPALFIAVTYLLGLNTLLVLVTGGLGYLLLSAHGVGYAAMMQGRGSPLNLYGVCSRLLGPARGTAVWVRALMGVQVLAFFNLHIALNFLLTLGRKLVGVDLTFAERFASLDNGQWLLFLAATTFALFEPVRAAVATLLLVDGRVRQEGLDLLASVQQLPSRNVGRPLPSPSASRGAAVLAVALGLGLLTATPARAAEAAEPLAPSEARQRLTEVAAACEAATPEDAAELYAPLDALGPQEAVKLDRFVRRVERLAYDVEDCDEARAVLLRGLATLGATVDAQAKADARAAAARAKDILARPEFAQAAPKAEKETPEAPVPPESPGWWRRFIDWLGELLKKLFEPEREAPRQEPGTPLVTGASAANVLVVVLVTLTLAVLGVVLLRALNRRKPGEGDEGVQVSTVDASTLAGDAHHALSRPPEGWAHLADELAARGAYREAVRSLYLALLSRLHRDGAILYDETLSNWDYLHQFRGRAEWKAPFRELTRRFDFAWYGNEPVGVDGYRAFRTLTEPLLAAPPRPEVAGA